MLRLAVFIVLATWLSPDVFAQTIHPRFLSNGEQIVFYNRTGESASVEIIDLESGEHSVLLADDGYYGNPGYIADSEDIILAGSTDGMRGSWELYRLGTDASLTALTETPEREIHPSSDSDGRRIAFVRFIDTGAHLFLLDISTNVETQLTEGVAQHFHPKFSADGEWLYFDRTLEENTGIYRIRLSDGDVQPVIVMDGADERATSPSLSPDGVSLAYSRRDNVGNHLVIHNFETGHEDVPVTTLGGVGGPHWSPEGNRLVFHRQLESGYQIEMLDVRNGEIEVLVAAPVGSGD
ncbi:TolB family protein [Hyphobacterium indicum]|uniref:TolB family protein n=1 Tax=Hyphobacterium indicum TaxID=2162714 RepID=UPI000D64E954|nr:PD40 domain-containing protein [Hyphobacterium indicum]